MLVSELTSDIKSFTQTLYYRKCNYFKLFLVLYICINNIYFVLFHADGDRPLIIGFVTLAVIVVILIIVTAVVVYKLRRWVYGSFSLHTHTRHDKN